MGVAASGDARIDGLLWGAKWAGAVSYSDPDARSDYGALYPSGPLDGFARLGAGQLAAARGDARRPGRAGGAGGVLGGGLHQA